jgi:hypothetical protein
MDSRVREARGPGVCPTYVSQICNTWMTLGELAGAPEAAANLAEDVPALELGVHTLAG